MELWIRWIMHNYTIILGKTLQTIDAGYQYVLHSTALKVCQETEPEIGALAFGYIRI